MLQACAPLISYSLSYIYNHSLYTGIFPDHPKIAVIKLLKKKRQKYNDKLQAYFIVNSFLRGT